MITFRYHIVSIVSVFLALAVGIALGGGPLKGEVDNTLSKEVAARKAAEAQLRADNSVLRQQLTFYDTVSDTTAGKVLGKKLAGRPVAVVALPGADADTLAGLESRVATAGGTVSGTYRIGEKLGLPGDRDVVDQLSSQLVEDAPGVEVDGGASAYERLGAVIGRAIGTPETTADYDKASGNIVSALNTAGLLSADGAPKGRAGLVLVLAGPPDASKAGKAAERIHRAVISALGKAVGGVVVSGSAASARPGGLLETIRGDVAVSATVSTVDSADTGLGRVVAVLALAEQAHGGSGQYGAVSAADGAMPGAVQGD